MDIIQKQFEMTLAQVPTALLQKILDRKLQAVNVKVQKKTLEKAANHILTGNSAPLKFRSKSGQNVTIQITEEDIKYIVDGTERLRKDHLEPVLRDAAAHISDRLYKYLSSQWTEHSKLLQSDVQGFKERLEARWGDGLSKLRMLLAIVREWADGAHQRRLQASRGKMSVYDEVMLRLHVRACQVTNEVIILLENGFADGAMARWRTLHEITVVAATIARFGNDIAERYMQYQIIESYDAIEAYERNHNELGFGPIPKRQVARIKKDYERVIARFGKRFAEEFGWAVHHLKSDRRLAFWRLEREAGKAFMHSPYKFASYNVHASPKGVYFRLGSLDPKAAYLAGPSNTGLTDPAQHTAVSLFEITMLAIGNNPILEDRVVTQIIARLELEIPKAFWKAQKKLQRDDKKYRSNTSLADR
jgi:Family of unknown function (DUF5677)